MELVHELAELLRAAGILPVGIAESTPAAPKKKPFEERAWFNGFGPGADSREQVR